MNLIISGGTGLIGKALIPQLISSGHQVSVIGRNKEKILKLFKNSVQAFTWDELSTLHPEDFSAIINLAGENISDHRWTSKTKARLLSSRVQATEQLVFWAQKANNKPHLYNASAIGIYGLQKNSPNTGSEFTECSEYKSNAGFASYLVHQWENAALSGLHAGMAVTLMRFAVVLKQGDGMLKKLEMPARLGLSAVVGTGTQPLSWISHVDLIRAILFLLDHQDITGPVNLVAPQYVSQEAFTQCLAKVLHRPSFLRLPSWLTRLLLGEMAEELLLSGQAVTPAILEKNSFTFQYPDLMSALNHEFKSP